MPNIELPVLLKDGEIVENTYQLLADDLLVPQGDVLLMVEQLDLLGQVSGKKALLVTVDSSPETTELPLSELDTIFIEFAGLNDGRGYSFAALLRRQGFKGELRAVGDIFKDVLNYLKRSGFDSFIIKEGKDIHEAASGLNDFKAPYQQSTAVPLAHYQTGSIV
ncbi:DUF934 domain-containing protein [Acinetobacter nectaris]|uniref:DUF934 domain-containing protein n=1 Tax=Acinetobacter nectaris TaxID=1219382 RepID=UPI001F1620DF|nr:DUF934 domain-containing protein [Acinetobacter nectaris]MCF8999772.1 DUF934 domain-containing protein [Acinetobacter nectaris]MCF9026714.1 DUF934 domain-containing protein [Acinetobacter nectaris]